ncbi:competence protein A [mine drainage metagenome]|uniref:Competence protein A n=1 Tax=mine drainage metagenome TaxID=410659 RepID=A0A1J5RBU0_9ZZZZ
MFRKRYAPLIGLDISSSSVKLVELSLDAQHRYTLERAALEPLDKGAVNDGNIERHDDVVEAVRRLLKRSGTKTRDVALALPSSAVITKKIVLPGDLREEEIEVQVESEANQYIPFAIEDVALDFSVLGPSLASPGDQEVLIAASRRDKVLDRQAVAEAAGLRPQIIDIDAFASRLAAGRLIERLPRGGQDLLIALFEIGASSTAMQVLRNGETLYDRDQAFGGQQLTQAIARHYGFSQEEAEIKKRNADLPDDYAAQVLEPFIDGMAQEIARALQFFFRATPNSRVDYVLLAGGTASLAGLVERITELTSTACMVLNPFDGMAIGSQVREKKLRLQSPSYLTSCGLAMRRFLS